MFFSIVRDEIGFKSNQVNHQSVHAWIFKCFKQCRLYLLCCDNEALVKEISKNDALVKKKKRKKFDTYFCKPMLVHPNFMNTCHFLTQFFTHNQTIQDVCTERNEFNKNSTFITVWSSYLPSQKFVLQFIINIATWFHVSVSRMLSLV